MNGKRTMIHRHRAGIATHVSAFVAILAPLAVAACASVTSSLCCTTEVFEDFRFDRDATGLSSFAIEGTNGRILVTRNSGGEAFVIRGEKRVGANSESDAAAGLAQITFDITEVGDELRIRSIHPVGRNRQYVVNWVLEVPRRLFGQVASVNGDVTMESLDNGLLALVTNGVVTLTDIEGNTEVSVVNGNLIAAVSIEGDEFIDLSTVNGNIALSVPSATNAELDVRTDAGSVTVTNLTLTNEQITNNVVTGTLGTGEGTIDILTLNGNITVTGS
jgi:hypothetical protein